MLLLLTRAAAGGSVNASGVTLTAAVSFIAGAADGVRNATASGVTLTSTASIIAGAATGGGAVSGNANGVTLTSSVVFFPGQASSDTLRPIVPSQGSGGKKRRQPQSAPAIQVFKDDLPEAVNDDEFEEIMLAIAACMATGANR
jgi:hypothetical protein